HADTFVIMKATKHPQEAFEAYMYLLNNKDLLSIYGAMPAIKALQDDFFKGLDTKFAPVKPTWQVALDSLAYPDVPNHEEDLPNFLKVKVTLTDFEKLLNTKADLDIPAEAKKLQEQL